VGDQRSTEDLAEIEIFGCRELLPTTEVQERAGRLVGEAPWGRQQWERLREGLVFDGMESWLPWLTSDERLLVDLLPANALVLLVEPRRMRDRAAELLEEEEALAGTLAQTWGADGEEFPRLHLPFDRLLAHTDAAVLTVTAAPEGPGTEVVAAAGWDPVVGDGERLMGQLRGLRAEGYRIVVCAEGRGSAARLATLLGDHGLPAPYHETPTAARLTDAGIRVVLQPLERGFLYPPLKLAVLAEGDLTGPGPPTPRPSSTTSPPAATWCTISTGWDASAAWCAARSAASSATTCCSNTRVGTSCTYLPTRSTCCDRTRAASRRP
jgi:transcription-repair coupling factor (superfamily II helicase)